MPARDGRGDRHRSRPTPRREPARAGDRGPTAARADREGGQVHAPVSRAGRRERALEWVGLARSFASANLAQLQMYSDAHLAEIHGDLPEAEIQAAYERGAGLDLDQVLGELLSGEPGEVVSSS